MALNIDQPEYVSNTNPNRPLSSHDANAQPKTIHPGMASWSLSGNGAMMGAVLARDVGSEIYAELKKVLLEAVKSEKDAPVRSYVIDFDNKNFPGMSFSSLIIATSINTESGLNVAYQPLLIEATGEALNNSSEYINGQSVDVQLTTDHAINGRYMDAALRAVQNHIPGAAVYRYVETIRLPRSFLKDNTVGIKQLAFLATLATNTRNIISMPDFYDMSLSAAARNAGGQLTVRALCNPAQVMMDVSGAPRRSDFSTSLTREVRGNNRSMASQINSPDAMQEVTRVNAFVDLEWQDTSNMGMMGQAAMYMNQQQLSQMTQRYFPRLVITDVVTSMALTPAVIMLAIAQISALRDSYAWMRGFMPLKERTSAQARRQLDLRDIGALNIEANILNEQNPSMGGTPIDLFADAEGNYKGAPSPQEVGQLLSRLVKPNLALSIDVPRAGPTTSFLAFLVRASDMQGRGNMGMDGTSPKTGTTPEYDIVYDAINQLTDSHFETLLPRGQELFVDPGNIIFEGTYIDTNGQTRPLSEIDRVAICNLFRDNPMQIRYWSDTFYDTRVQLEQRLATRARMLKAALPTAEITGLIDRVTLSAACWTAMDQAIFKTGVHFEMQANYSSEDLGAPRMGPAWANAATVQAGGGFARMGYGYGNGGQGLYAAPQYAPYR